MWFFWKGLNVVQKPSRFYTTIMVCLGIMLMFMLLLIQGADTDNMVGKDDNKEKSSKY